MENRSKKEEKIMWRKEFSDWKPVGSVILAACMLLCGWAASFTTLEAHAQNAVGTRQTYDPLTERSLQNLQKLLMAGNPEEVKQLMQRIIDGSGYIQPLAEIIYRLAQDERDGKILVNYYFSLIEHYPHSAWAEKAVLELVPLLIMNGGDWGRDKEALIWQNANNLLAPAPDAADLGENPEDLRADVFLQLLHLAHFRNDDAQVNALIAQIPPRATAFQDQVDLAKSYALGRGGNRTSTRTSFKEWLDRYPNSEYRPLASLALYLASDRDTQLQEALGLVDSFHNTLEAMWLHSNLGR